MIGIFDRFMSWFGSVFRNWSLASADVHSNANDVHSFKNKKHLRYFCLNGTVREWNGSIWLVDFRMSGSVNRYGKVFKSHILGTPIIVSTDSELNKVILQNHGNTFVPAYPKTIRELLGENSILQTNGSLQKRIHALIGGFLRSPQLKSHIVRDIESSVKLTLASWGVKGGSILFQEEIKKVCLTLSLYLHLFMPFHD